MCTLEKLGNLFILIITGEDQHRLNPARIDAIRSALDRVRADPGSHSSSALITTAQGKFFSNGFDLDWAHSSPDRFGLMSSKLRALIIELLCFPMPTIAAVTGHASAAGFLLALAYDYVLMRKDRGFLYMSETDIGLKIPSSAMALIKSKIGDPMTRRDVILKAAKITGQEAVERKIVHGGYDSAEETLKGAISLGEELAKRGWDGQVYSQNRMSLFKDVLDEYDGKNTNKVLSKI
ncbi:Crotonase superfamily [Corchorus capsularis]|uniref:Delta(3)-Delta(2)-enoyl-CoA isomerase n=1 Tax=Corchorus capsularis TaxID=210143 RepID=A0A1R3GLG6_COCAP|nr:Crotonase superfamily [Corchorus capsularis]